MAGLDRAFYDPHEPNNKDINAKKVILVEGTDECYFLSALMEHLHIYDIQVKTVGGKAKFYRAVEAFVLDPDFSKVECFALIRDADRSRKRARDYLRSVLKANKQPCPAQSGQFKADTYRKVGLFIIPRNGKQGDLDDLCIEAVNVQAVMPCVNDYMTCVGNNHPAGKTKESKMKSQVYLAAMKEMCRGVGMGARKGYFDLDHQCMTEIKNFLSNM